MNVLVIKLKEVLFAVLPITFIVIILNFTLTPLDSSLMIRFLIGAFLIIIGLTIFLLGVDISVSNIGKSMGTAIAKSNKLWIVITAGIILGFFISIAEPDLHILAGEVAFVTSGLVSKLSIVIIVSIGIAIMLSLGLVRIIFGIPLYKILTGIYIVIFGLAFFVSPEFLAISFDASGATTGAMTVPFILALALGISALKKDSKSSEKDSFGLVAIASAGAILAVMIMSIFTNSDKITGAVEYHETVEISIMDHFMKELPKIAYEVMLALIPILILFIIFNFISIRLSKKALRKILIGLIFTYIGLVFFLLGVNAGFMDVGSMVGSKLAAHDNKLYVVLVGFILGLVTILAEPAVYVLTHQIEDVTSGYVQRKVVMITLSLGVGIAVALSVLRILIPGLQLWHILLPGYLIAIILMFFVPKLFIGMAFDSGGVASGPMTATFILAFAQGAAESIEGADVLVDGFGVIAMVAMTPLIALQILGLIFKIKSKKEDLQNDD